MIQIFVAIALAWTGVGNSYRVYRDGIDIADTSQPSAEIQIESKGSTVWVTALDSLGLESTPSNSIRIAAPPTVEIERNENGTELTLSGCAGQRCEIERSSDLIGWQTWNVVTLGANPTQVTDPDSAAPAFYRVVADVTIP